MSREIKCPRAWDDVLGEMLYSKPEQFDNSLTFRFDNHFETENPVYMWPTGLRDRNGKEIYEGDIILLGKAVRHIEYDRGSFTLFAGDRRLSPISDYNSEDKYEVIGNIYEHPYLLGERGDSQNEQGD